MPLIAVDARTRRAVIAGGLRGPAGRDGAPGGQTETFVAGEPLGGHRVVYASGSTVRYADGADASTAAQVVGVTTQAADSGTPIIVQRVGRMTEATWAWTPGPVFLGANGLPTQTTPQSGVYLQIGAALDATTLDVRIGTPFDLE